MLSGCGSDSQPAQPSTPTFQATDLAGSLKQRLSADAVMAHLTKLQQIADANGGNRAAGTPGYEASVDYVADTLRSKGFDVQIPEFELRMPFADPPTVTVAGTVVDAKPLEYTVG